MGNGRLLHILFPLSLLVVIPFACGWGYDGHIVICRIAQAHLSKVAAQAVRKLMPNNAKGDLGIICPWADTIKYRYRWSSDLHFVNIPDHLCTYKYNRDCIGRNGDKGRCLAGAINNYTAQLTYKKHQCNYNNLTEALLFLSHFIGDIHQPLHVAYKSDKGGNTIKVMWFTRKQSLHHVWDTDIIRTWEGGLNASKVDGLTKGILQKINTKWKWQIHEWGVCSSYQKTCPNVYASESIKAACEWAYKGVHSGSILKEDYYRTRLPIVELRIAQAGIRLAATLNRIFT
ncbi:endonuclease 2 [Phtheirospermum japonicum]|uniref:Aspergillus nuclease S1 n=1 Tax=Phtheirospermum japonicum TaxID=374723 RepID=A0A830BKN3_9LAMI|nr:endonuclease 2 [Phtheirospermum japonicum]